MNNKQLYYLVDVATTHSISATALRVFTTQQAVSYELKKLEEELSCQLLERSRSGAYLTKNGQDAVQFARHFLEQFGELQKKIAQNNLNAHGEMRNNINLVTTSIMSATIFPFFFTCLS